MQTAPAMGRLAGEIKDRLDTGQDSKPPRCPQHKSHAAQRLNRLTARLDALCVSKEDIERRIAIAQDMLERGCLFTVEVDDLQDAVRAWRMAAARVVLDLHDFGDVRRPA